ncbi:Putative ubiquitin interacting, XPG/Rad2 endonuclease, XPG-I domain, PIN-like domain superfamily [Septoria linicola]|uniref:Ubiquitin interacting, XPG/Rad2 endonuclease, XPG-I domain, PIN-like domain superfamily n=1 Tax=Septoria linicola TaxID=215465 RepID=A0A9Q9EG65_9PEZI|nr:putative ubiquitin interacting, XPG/Rad2 endonuclease, XPG-I domain, PIN-like domain superfamily [Septoria linicola]USW47973.1 Putative ubiquitin interacting, XPG/Rad2 endonuclease, XPG-I domain, PIN-like domain superfamily [Septoria linicola]
MGVTGLWQILQPCARPIKIETLNRKRLAVDASIWIYQFLKAVRDKEGNALRNSHVVGFFRRICKLLFFGIKPVFVFDGGAPALKRQTIRARKSRREGRREDAVRTAGKLLAVQMQRAAEEEEERRKREEQQQRGTARDNNDEEEVPDEGLVYVDELQMSAQERQQSRKFRKKDAYHLPDLDMSMSEMGGPNDPRVMSLEDLQAYAAQFNTGEELAIYDFSKIDYDSPFFMSLPASDRYNILNAARLRSRLRMGHSKEQLDVMFPDRMAFSKFQIERVAERNELTQRLMHLNESGGAEYGGGRVVGEKGREYVLVKNDGVEGGWALGVIDDEGKEEKPIDLDAPALAKDEDEDWEDEDDFEDVPVEGLNRLPKPKTGNDGALDALQEQRRALYKSRGARERGMGDTSKRPPQRKRKQKAAEQDPDSLFIQDSDEDAVDDPSDQPAGETELFGDADQHTDDEDLRKAIAMSMQKDGGANDENDSDAEENVMLDAFQQSAMEEAMPVPKGSARAIANILNKRAHHAAPESREITSFGVPTQKADSSDDEEVMDLQAALAESRKTKRKTSPLRRKAQVEPKAAESNTKDIAKKAGFSGPLPFEKLDLGTSLLGKKKMQQRTEEAAGGFENPALGEKKKNADPLPPWFSGDVERDLKAQKAIEDGDRERARAFDTQYQFQDRGSTLRRGYTNEVIDLEADDVDVTPSWQNGEIIDLETSSNNEPATVETQPKLGDVADEIRARPIVLGESEQLFQAAPSKAPPSLIEKQDTTHHSLAPNTDSGIDPRLVSKNTNVRAVQLDEPTAVADTAVNVPFDEDSDEELDSRLLAKRAANQANAVSSATAPDTSAVITNKTTAPASESDEEMLEWSESDLEDAAKEHKGDHSKSDVDPIHSGPEASPTRQSRSPSMEFEDVATEQALGTVAAPTAPRPADEDTVDANMFEDLPGVDEETQLQSAHTSGIVAQETLPDDDGEFDDFSDPEEAEMLRNLTIEAEEHARFASSLNNKPQAQNIAEYEKELKQLRNQQKKDRRDADEVTQTMIQECQALLRLFGLPYVTAPMEAEAQCAELVKLGLVDGIVTDDSDCFLFGGTRIYKNMFNQAKFVECYLTSDLEKEFDLTRQKLISVANLLGSDYTEGLPGVGPVTALEIISEFPSLEEFRDWWTAVQMNQIHRSEDASNPFRKKFRRNASKLFLPHGFPDRRVEMAYLEPEVDADPEAFQWGVPDLDKLRSFLMATIGWSQERTDEVLVPVIKDMNRRLDEGTQANITAFFDGGVGIGAAGVNNKGEAFAPRKRVDPSKRMGTALGRMAEKAKGKRTRASASPAGEHDINEATEAESNTNDDDKPKGARSKKRKVVRAAQSASESDEGGSESDKPKRAAREAPSKRGRRRKAAT